MAGFWFIGLYSSKPRRTRVGRPRRERATVKAGRKAARRNR